MKAFSGFITKPMILKEMKAHQKADNFVRGKYFQNGKGCSVGCAIESINKIKKEENRHGNHTFLAKEIQVPEWLMHMNDRIFEGVSIDRSKKWPVELLEAINEGSDLDKIKIPFLIFLVESAREKTKNAQVLLAIDAVLTELKRDVLDKEKLLEARRNVRADAAAAAYAADAAAAAADAAAYADAYAAAAAAAADAAAYAAAAYAAAAADARKNEYEKFADKLLELIRNCK